MMMSGICSCPHKLEDAKGLTVQFEGRILALGCAIHKRDALIAAQRIFGRDQLAAEVAVEFEEERRSRRLYWFAGIPTELDLHAARKAVARRLNISLETVESILAAPVPPNAEIDDAISALRHLTSALKVIGEGLGK